MDRRDCAFGIERKPALAARIFRPRVPSNAQRLQASFRQLDEILLERGYSECVADLEVCSLLSAPSVLTQNVSPFL